MKFIRMCKDLEQKDTSLSTMLRKSKLDTGEASSLEGGEIIKDQEK